MGQTLENGVYLPSEGERNCYAGLKTNWEILDQKVADVTALQQAVAGALHREIVESLPTTDIDPNTIYMILSGTSATENVYNEYMYVNNAWELIGTSATDLTNYYTKAEVDGKLLLKANDSDVVHKIGDETVSGVKSFIDYFLGKDLSGQTVDLNDCVDAYGGAIHYYYAVSNYTNISNKPENKPFILESKTVRYVSSIDHIYYQKIYTADYNAPPSIYTRYYRSGSASWSNWVKDTDKFVTTDTNQTITGNKTFLDVPISFKSSTVELGVTGGSTKIIFTDKNLLNLAGITFGNYESSKLSYCRFHIYDKDSDNQEVENFIEFSYVNSNQSAFFRPNKSNFVSLGTVSNRWARVYSTQYYYGNNNVEFSTKFVTTDTAQTISGAKTFSSNVNVYNSDSTTDTANIVLKNSKAERGSTTNIGEQTIFFLDKDNAQIGNIKCEVDSYGVSTLNIQCTNPSNGSSGIRLRRTSAGTFLQPTFNNGCNLGTSGYRWYDVQTRAVNNLEPSSLSLPDLDNGIDISSYITVNGGNKESFYTPTVNGWISVALTRTSGSVAAMLKQGNLASSGHRIDQENGTATCNAMLPVKGGVQVSINSALADGIAFAYFYPCQGNV